MRITVKDLGDHSRELHHVRAGTTVFLEGPYGAFTGARRRRQHVLLLAGGVGIAPLRALFETLRTPPGGMTLVYRVSRDEDLAFRSELDAIAAARGARVHYLVGSRNGPRDPFVGRRLSKLVHGVERHDIFVCGSPSFNSAAAAAAQRCGVPAGQVHIEDFAF